jgi:hypothetical protein
MIAVALASQAQAQAKTKAKAEAQSGYATDAITAIAPSRHATFPTATCTVWANAEGLGVGPAQLNGFHGLSLSINPHPLPTDGGPITLDTAVGVMKASLPGAPAWMVKAIENHRAAIDAACAKDSETPILIYRLTDKDRS